MQVAYAFMQKNDWQKAIADYTDIIKRAPNDAGARERRGFAYRNLKQYDKAIEDFNVLIKMSPKDIEAYRRRAYAYSLAGQDNKAIEDLKKILQLQPNDADAQKRLKALQAKAPPQVRTNLSPTLAASPGSMPAASPAPFR